MTETETKEMTTAETIIEHGIDRIVTLTLANIRPSARRGEIYLRRLEPHTNTFIHVRHSSVFRLYWRGYSHTNDRSTIEML